MEIKKNIVKWENHVKRKKIIATDVTQTPVVFPPAKTKKRIQPTLLSNTPQPAQGLDSSNQTAGQKRMQNTVNRMEKFYSDPHHQF